MKRNITITDITGKVIGKYETVNQLITVPVGHLTRGVYIVTVKEGTDVISTKIVKE